VLLPTPSNSRTSTRCTKRPCTTRYGPPRWSMQSAQHMCMCAMISLCVVCSQGVSRIRARALCSPSRMRIRAVFSLACSWTGPRTCSSGRRSRRRRRVAHQHARAPDARVRSDVRAIAWLLSRLWSQWIRICSMRTQELSIAIRYQCATQPQAPLLAPKTDGRIIHSHIF
jgi:hypothetical protein